MSAIHLRGIQRDQRVGVCSEAYRLGDTRDLIIRFGLTGGIIYVCIKLWFSRMVAVNYVC